MVALGVGAKFGLTGKLLPVGLLLGGSMASCQPTRRHSDDRKFCNSLNHRLGCRMLEWLLSVL